jgi:pimeloyl-ACP methyl ester carboxylesterase
VFDLIQGGKKIGTSWGRYDGPLAGGLHQFSTRVELRAPTTDARNTAPPEPLRSVGEIVLDARGELLRGFERSRSVELRFERSDETLVFTTGREREELGFRPGTAFMAFATMFHEELMFGLRELKEGPLAWRLISLSGSLPSDWSATLTVPDPAAPTIAVVSTSLGEVIHLRDGRIERVEVSADDLEVVVPAKPAAWPTWTIEAPPTLSYALPAGAKFTRRELELPGQPGEPKLVGELLIPAGKGPFPALLFLSSTGQQDRHGFAGPPPVDLGSHEITDALAQAGFAVLRYDERGFGGSAEGSISYSGQLEDARRGLRTLQVQDEVDPDRIAIVGHGEGGWKGLQLAGEGRGVRAVALLASPGRPYEEVLKAQAALAVEAVPPELRAEVKKTQERTLTALRTGKGVPPELERSATWNPRGPAGRPRRPDRQGRGRPVDRAGRARLRGRPRQGHDRPGEAGPQAQEVARRAALPGPRPPVQARDRDLEPGSLPRARPDRRPEVPRRSTNLALGTAQALSRPGPRPRSSAEPC